MQTLNRITVIYAWFMLTIMVLLVSSAAFSQVRRATTKELSEKSTAIVVGKCTKKESFWNDKHTQILTEVKIQNGESIKGKPGEEVVITIPGGRVGNTIYEVSDMPIFQEGEEVLVFLWRHPSGKNLVTGALQGKLTIVEDKKTGKKVLQGAQQLLKEDRPLLKRTITRAKAPTKIFLDDFIKEVKGLVKE